VLKTWITKNRMKYLDMILVKNIKEGEIEEEISPADEMRLRLTLLILDAIKCSSTELCIKNCFRKSGLCLLM